MSDAWTTTASADELAHAWRTSRRVVVLTHAKPDGDAIGSSLAVARTVRLCGGSAESWFVGPMPRWAREIAGASVVRTLAPGESHASITNGQPEPDLIVVVDTGTWSQLGEWRSYLSDRRDRVVVVDHHVHGDIEVSSRRHLRIGSASCTEILADVCVRALGCGERGAGGGGTASASDLPREVAEPLFLGLATDTGWFRFSSVTPTTLRLAGDLLDAGVNHTDLYRIVEQQDALSRYRLMARALASLQTYSLSGGGQVAILCLREDDFVAAGADRTDTGGFSDVLLHVSEVRAAGLLIEQPRDNGAHGSIVKASFRSKPGPNAIDVAAAMAQLGGGGHVRAAGAKVDGTLGTVLPRVLHVLGVEA